MARDLTREDIRHLVRVGLEQTRGNYKALVQLFNMEPQDYKRFLNFLRKYGCHMPFQRFRMAPLRPDISTGGGDGWHDPLDRRRGADPRTGLSSPTRRRRRRRIAASADRRSEAPRRKRPAATDRRDAPTRAWPCRSMPSSGIRMSHRLRRHRRAEHLDARAAVTHVEQPSGQAADDRGHLRSADACAASGASGRSTAISSAIVESRSGGVTGPDR